MTPFAATPVDRILTNGRFITVDARFSIAEAVAIADERIVAVGPAAEIAPLAHPATRIDDLGGATVLPGLIDAHTHMLSVGALLRNVQLYDCRSIDEILARVRERAATTAPGEWIVGRGWDESLLAERRFPTRWELDTAAPDHPVVLNRVWNKLVCNSRALAIAGIDRTTPQPFGEAYAGGFDVDERGEPTGLFRDNAKQLILGLAPPLSQSERVEIIAEACHAYNAVGITTMADPGLTPEEVGGYAACRSAGRLTVRSHLMVGAWGFYPPGLDYHAIIAGLGVAAGFGDARLRYDAVKFMVDGGIGDRTAAVSVPYVGGGQGTFIVPPDQIASEIRWCHDHDWPVECHVCGDRAQATVVDAIIAAQEASPKPQLRHRVHHAYVPDDETVTKMAAYGIPAVIQPGFLHGLGESYIASLGIERARMMIPARRYLDAGVPLAGSSDAPVADYNPFIGIWAAVARQTAAGRDLDAAHSLTREEAIRLYTTGAAHAIREEATRGTIEPGKLADFVVLDRDILMCPTDQIRAITPRKTIVGGTDVFVRR
ncbi:MAG: amidohydrolase [Chloroflexota bacterium]|nr:amidohydrolase [Chloroflexota bacterium]